MSDLFPRGYCVYCLNDLDNCTCHNTCSITSSDLIISNKEEFKWDDNKVIEFVSWYLELCKLNVEDYCIENLTIIESFKRGDSVDMWRRSDDIVY